MIATNKKIYMVPETACEQFLRTMGVLMDSGEFGKGDANKPGPFTAPKRDVF